MKFCLGISLLLAMTYTVGGEGYYNPYIASCPRQCSDSRCDCDETDYYGKPTGDFDYNCHICHDHGCSQCKGSNGQYFKLGNDYFCESCRDMFPGCIQCHDYQGCGQCEVGYERKRDYYTCGEPVYYCERMNIPSPTTATTTRQPTPYPTTRRPTPRPTPRPTERPTPRPTERPTERPTNRPTPRPTDRPTPRPTNRPTPRPTDRPTPRPTERPTPRPTNRPTPRPTDRPTPRPTDRPTDRPTPRPTPRPTNRPTPRPTNRPTPRPTDRPTPRPTNRPTPRPTDRPTPRPTDRPTTRPTDHPTPRPTNRPTPRPTDRPTPRPTDRPTPRPTPRPTSRPTNRPTLRPTSSPVDIEECDDQISVSVEEIDCDGFPYYILQKLNGDYRLDCSLSSNPAYCDEYVRNDGGAVWFSENNDYYFSAKLSRVNGRLTIEISYYDYNDYIMIDLIFFDMVSNGISVWQIDTNSFECGEFGAIFLKIDFIDEYYCGVNCYDTNGNGVDIFDCYPTPRPTPRPTDRPTSRPYKYI